MIGLLISDKLAYAENALRVKILRFSHHTIRRLVKIKKWHVFLWNAFLFPRSIKSFFSTPCFSAIRQGKNISHQEILCNRANCTWNLSSNLPRNTQLRFSGNKRFIPWPQYGFLWSIQGQRGIATIEMGVVAERKSFWLLSRHDTCWNVYWLFWRRSVDCNVCAR